MTEEEKVLNEYKNKLEQEFKKQEINIINNNDNTLSKCFINFKKTLKDNRNIIKKEFNNNSPIFDDDYIDFNTDKNSKSKIIFTPQNDAFYIEDNNIKFLCDVDKIDLLNELNIWFKAINKLAEQSENYYDGLID